MAKKEKDRVDEVLNEYQIEYDIDINYEKLNFIHNKKSFEGNFKGFN